MQQPFSNRIGWVDQSVQSKPLGYTEYGNIFSKYIIHGVKLNWIFRYVQSTINSNHTVSIGVAFHTANGTTTPSSLSGSAPAIATYPLGSIGVLTPDRPYRFKRYAANSKVSGVDVRKFDRFTKLWVAAPDPNPIWLGLTCRTSLLPNGDSIQLLGSATWYVSAIAIKEQIGTDPTLVNMTVPLKEDFGEPATPGVIDHGTLLSTGVAQNKRTLQEMNMGGNA